MNRTLIIISMLTLFAACSKTDPKSELFNQIKELEQSDTMGTQAGLDLLASLHERYGMSYKDSLANQYLYSAAMYNYYSDHKETAKPMLIEYMNRPDSGIQMRNTLFALTDLNYASGSLDSFELTSDKLLDNYVPTPQQYSTLAKIYDDKIKSNNSVQVKDYERLSSCLIALGAFKASLETIDTALVKFPDAENRAKMIYRAGFIAWDYLKDPSLAEQYYKQFITEFPDHELAPEVQDIINSGKLKMTDEEILEMIKGQG